MNQQSGWFAPPPPQRARGQETHVLSVKQEPERGKAVVRGKEKDRKPIDPPPIIQLEVYDQYPQAVSSMFVHNPYYFCCCSLWDSQRDEPKKAEGGQPLLVGSTVSSLHRLKDLQNREGGYFVFGDVSCGIQGRFRLRFSLYEMNPREGTVKYLRSVVSQAFDIANSKEWDGVKESTSLSRSFADQGVRLRLRKESRNSSNKRPFAPPFSATPSAPHTPATAARMSHGGPYESHSSDEDASAHGEPALKRPRSIPQSHGMSSDYPARYPPHSQGGYPAPYSYNSGHYSSYPQGSYASSYAPGALRTPQSGTMPPYGTSYHTSNMSVQSPYPGQAAGGYGHSQYGNPPYQSGQPGPGAGPYYGSQHQSPHDQQRTSSGYAFAPSYGSQAAQPPYYGTQSQYETSPSSMLPSSGAANVRPMANPASTPTLAPINRPSQNSDQVMPSVEAEAGQASHH